MKKSSILWAIKMCLTIGLMYVFTMYFRGYFDSENKIVPFNSISKSIKDNSTTFDRITIDEHNQLAYFYKYNTTSYDHVVRLSANEDFEKKLRDAYTDQTDFENVNVKHIPLSTFRYWLNNMMFAFILYYFVQYFLGKTIFGDTTEEQTIFPLVKDVKIRFSDVIGLEPVKREFRQYINFIKNRQKYLEYGAKIPAGLLLIGPPGCGKTLLAKALAGESNISYIYVSGSDFIEKYVGTGQKRVKELFEFARKNTPCIIFIDEIDSIGRKRKGGAEISGHSEHSTTLNKLLIEMDGFNETDNVLVIAATNMPELLDKALLRSGRFDKQVVFDLPNIKEREALFKMYLSKVKLTKDIKDNLDENCTVLAKMTAGLTGADIANIANQSIIEHFQRMEYFNDNNNTLNKNGEIVQKLIAEAINKVSVSALTELDAKKDKDNKETDNEFKDIVKTIELLEFDDKKEDDIAESTNLLESKEGDTKEEDTKEGDTKEDTKEGDTKEDTKEQELGVTFKDIRVAMDNVMIGMEKRERMLSEKERNIVAHHETGHALTAYLLKHTTCPVKVSIVPRGVGALGFSQQESTDQKLHSGDELCDRLCVMLGGRAAEDIIFDTVTTGASDDIQKATGLAYQMVTKYGLSDTVGPICYDPNKLSQQYYSNSTKETIDNEVKSLISLAYDRTHTLLTTYEQLLKDVAKRLLENEVLLNSDLEEMVGTDLKNSA